MINKISSAIIPTLYPKKLPKHILYHTVEGRKDIFRMFSPTQKKHKGVLVCEKMYSNFLRKDYSGPIYAIDFVSATPWNNNIGTELLNFAKAISKNSDCNGYIVLKADSSFTPNRIPHLFYRKNDFSSLDKKIDKKMDKFIKKGKIATHKDFPCIIMHYPAEKQCNRYQNIINKFFKLFK